MDQKKYNQILNEEIYIKMLPSGIKCYIIPKKSYVESQAVITTNFGSTDSKFSVNDKIFEVPDGVAHFLEHKLFENKKKDIFYEFSKQGADVNAFTNFTNTAYYFNCIDNFYDNLELLLEFTSSPHFTDENIEKEKGIIAEEINMYKDNPFWEVYLAMLSAMYSNSPVKKNIAGSCESISEITKELLYDCYNTFYVPRNMALVCVGDVDFEKVYEITGKFMSDDKDIPFKRIFDTEPDNILQNYTEKKMNVSMPMFNIGFKCKPYGVDVSEDIVTTKLIMDILCGESSLFFQDLYKRNLLDAPFSLEYTCSNLHATIVFGGSSQEPKKVHQALISEIENLTRNGISEQRFQQIKRKHLGRYIRSFNNIDAIATAQVDLFYKNIDLFGIIDSYAKVTLSQLQEKLETLFDENKCVLSVISKV